MKRHLGTTQFPTRPQPHPRPPPAVAADSNGDAQFEVERILTQRGTGPKRQFLVRWLGYPPEEDTWEPRASLADAADAMRDWERNRDSA